MGSGGLQRQHPRHFFVGEDVLSPNTRSFRAHLAFGVIKKMKHPPTNEHRTRQNSTCWTDRLAGRGCVLVVGVLLCHHHHPCLLASSWILFTPCTGLLATVNRKRGVWQYCSTFLLSRANSGTKFVLFCFVF